MIFPGVGFLKNAKIINDFFLIINLYSMHPFMDHILKLNTGQGSIYSNSQIIYLLINLSTFSLKIFFKHSSTICHVSLHKRIWFNDFIDQVLHSTKVSRLILKSNFLFSCMVQLTRNTLSYSNLTLVKRSPNLLSKGFCLDTCIGVFHKF